jgi:hypothetical protein
LRRSAQGQCALVNALLRVRQKTRTPRQHVHPNKLACIVRTTLTVGEVFCKENFTTAQGEQSNS